MDRNLLPSIAAFAEVAREGNFTHAALKLGISPSGLSQMIRALEVKIGVRLLNRSTRSVSVTDEGRRLLAEVDPGLAMIGHAVGALRNAGDRPTGEVRINSSRIAASHFIAPYIGEFRRRYPEVILEIVIDDGFGDIIREGCDAGIRLREGIVDSMIAVPISPPISMAVVASSSYLTAFSAPDTPYDLERHNCLGMRHGNSTALSLWEFTDPRDSREFTIEPGGSFVTNGDDIILSAALQGVGLVMHMDFAVRKHIAAGKLIRVLEEWCPPFDGFDLYLQHAIRCQRS
jgi:DNA-binding transcriptional LysR family regulator